MRKDTTDFDTSFLSEAGTLTINKDYFAFMELDDYACWITAHGIDSEVEVNSAEIAVQSIFSDFAEKPTISRRKIKRYMINAHKSLKQQSGNIKLKSSLTMVVTDYAKIVWAISGNGKLHHFRKGRFNFKSRDQSVAQLMADVGEIKEVEVDRHLEKDNLLNYLGISEKFKPFISKKYKLIDGDIMLLSTPGFSGKLDYNEIIKTLSDTKKSSEFVESLEEKLLNKQGEVINNYTIGAIFAEKVFVEKKVSKMTYFKRIAAVMIPILMLGGAFSLYRIKSIKKQVESRQALIKHEKTGDEFTRSGYYDTALEEYKDAQKYVSSAKDKKREIALDRKTKVAQLIINADESFENKEYEKAMMNYEKAKRYIKSQKDFDVKELDEKIAKTKEYIEILKIQKEADALLNDENFEDAKALHENAKKRAQAVGFEEADDYSKDKHSEASKSINSIDKQKREVQAKDLEKRGDKQYSGQIYDEAIVFYESAQKIYQEINNIQGVLSMERKISASESALNPVIPASQPIAVDPNYYIQQEHQANNILNNTPDPNSNIE